MPTRRPLLILIFTCFMFGAMNVSLTGRVLAHQPWDLVEKITITMLGYWWYHADKSVRNYHAGVLLNSAVAFLAVVAIPVYLLRSRGAKPGLLACVGFIGCCVGALLAIAAGGEIAKRFAQ